MYVYNESIEVEHFQMDNMYHFTLSDMIDDRYELT